MKVNSSELGCEDVSVDDELLTVLLGGLKKSLGILLVDGMRIMERLCSMLRVLELRLRCYFSFR
jgi:hypothetical protein